MKTFRVSSWGCSVAAIRVLIPIPFAMRWEHLYDDLSGTGCRFIGACDTAGYSFDSSEAVRDGKFVGLSLDETNEDDRTAERIAAWVETLKKEGL